MAARPFDPIICSSIFRYHTSNGRCFFANTSIMPYPTDKRKGPPPANRTAEPTDHISLNRRDVALGQQSEDDSGVELHPHNREERRAGVLERGTDMPDRVVDDQESVMRLLVALRRDRQRRILFRIIRESRSELWPRVNDPSREIIAKILRTMVAASLYYRCNVDVGANSAAP